MYQKLHYVNIKRNFNTKNKIIEKIKDYHILQEHMSKVKNMNKILHKKYHHLRSKLEKIEDSFKEFNNDYKHLVTDKIQLRNNQNFQI